ncbi:class I adenylate-forming enzyme family protein [Spirillospora sp. NPDC048911]|uniref:class I adenylate-forming enzyme family protein n=1 Tax=Spirillospora sp. NPDC048911 TaxID=3364527 RepID=UPI0037104AA5
MTRGYGTLTIDREPVDSVMLRRLVDDATAAVPKMGDGECLACASDDPLSVLVTVLAARNLALPAVLGDRPFDSAQATPKVGTRLLVRSGAVEACRTPDPKGLPVPADTAVVFWTSGTSGEPKAVLHGAEAMEYQASATAEQLHIGNKDSLLLPLPLTHSYGHSVMSTWLLTGAALHIQHGFRAEPIARALTTDRMTTLDGVPTSYLLLLRMARSDPGLRRALASLRVRGCGGDLLPRSLAERFILEVGVPLHDGYGLTEAGPNVAIGSPSQHRLGTVGKPLSGTEVRIDPQAGELLVRSPSLMLGYLGSPGAGFTDDGWLLTGDAGAIDSDGFVQILGRRKETIIVHGETFPPETLEEAIASCPGVEASGVVGLPSGQPRGDQVIAFVEVNPTSPASEAARASSERGTRTAAQRIREACATVLPPQFVPRHVVVVSKIPRLQSQKVDRRALRRMAQKIDKGALT